MVLVLDDGREFEIVKGSHFYFKDHSTGEDIYLEWDEILSDYGGVLCQASEDCGKLFDWFGKFMLKCQSNSSES